MNAAKYSNDSDLRLLKKRPLSRFKCRVCYEFEMRGEFKDFEFT